MIKVIVDSGTDQNTWFESNYDFGFLPLSVILENKAYLDKKEITQHELHEAMKEGKMPTTSQPSPGQIKTLLDEYYKNNNEVIFISIWKNISGTFQSISSVVEEYKTENPEFKVEIIDCQSASVAGSILAIQTLEMIKAGYSFDEIVKQARWNAKHISIYLAADDLKWLVKGGRLSKTAGFIGSALNVKPIISVDDKELYSQEVVRGKKRAYKRMVEKLKNDTEKFSNQLYLISHVNNFENAQEVEKLLKEQIPEAKTMIFEFGAVIAAHIGLGGVAIAGITEKPKIYIEPNFK